jgi:hypothetical protein
LEKVHHREETMTKKYGGLCMKDKTCYGAETFIGWLVAEKGAKKIPFSEYCMAEFD